jgi:hypothetical protein
LNAKTRMLSILNFLIFIFNLCLLEVLMNDKTYHEENISNEELDFEGGTGIPNTEKRK